MRKPLHDIGAFQNPANNFRRMYMKRFLCAIAVVCSLFAFSCSKKGGSTKLRFVTGGESGTYYAFGSVLAQHATNNTPVSIISQVGSGSQGNVNKIQDSEAELGFCQSDVAAYAYNGTNLFAKTGKVTNFSVLASLYDEQVQIITTNPNIKSVSDLRGKKVSIGSSGSGVYFNALDVLGEYGMTENDINATYQSFGDSANDLRDGKIDAAFIVAGAPTTAVVDLNASKKAYLISIEENHVANLIKNHPFYKRNVISRNVYGTDRDIVTLSVSALILVRDDVAEDAVYAFTKDIFEKSESLVSLHAKYAELSLDAAAGIKGIPYHKGSAKYFKEKGRTVEVK